MSDSRSVAVLGLGAMGHAFATNLLKADFEVTVWNRSADKAGDLVEGGGRGIWLKGGGGGISDLSQVTPKPTSERPARGEPTVGPGAIHLSDSVSVYTLREW